MQLILILWHGWTDVDRNFYFKELLKPKEIITLKSIGSADELILVH